MVSNIMTEEELESNKKVFRFIDKELTGDISPAELCRVMSTGSCIGDHLKEEDKCCDTGKGCTNSTNFVDNADLSNSGRINYSEFLASTLEKD